MPYSVMYDVAQVARDGGVAVVPADVGFARRGRRRGVARSISTERASGSACAIATKLYCPPTPDTTRPSSSASDTAAPSAVAIMQVLKKRGVAALQALERFVAAVELVDLR